MPASKQDPLQTLDQMLNEILIQTGKHIRASLKDGSKGVGSVNNAIRSKTSDSLSSYHYALDDIEIEITRAKAVLLRDLEKLRASRVPVPVPAPVPAPQPVAPPAPMMELPSSAAHTMSTPAFASRQESRPAAPFPDMRMGMTTDVVDLTINDKKPSPRVSTSAVRPPARVPPPGKNEVKPSPKQASKPTPRATQPPKVTPVPPPQIPRLQPPQPPAVGSAATTQSQPMAQQAKSAQNAPAAQAVQDSSLNTTLSIPPNLAGGNTNTAGRGNALSFTDMQFSLAPSNGEAPGAPPAPMPEFDMTTFAPQDGGNGVISHNPRLGNENAGNTTTGGQTPSTAPQQQQKEQDKSDTNLDDLFNLDNTNGGTDSMFDLGGSGVNDSTFDDMMYFDSNDTDMTQFDETYFLR
ncbi:hypothetical protein AAE478_003114 [Parahypoxylon ruwenzoriense]